MHYVYFLKYFRKPIILTQRRRHTFEPKLRTDWDLTATHKSKYEVGSLDDQYLILAGASIVASTACQTKHTELLSNEWVQFYTTINIYRLKTCEIPPITYQFLDQFIVEDGKMVPIHFLSGLSSETSWFLPLFKISQDKWSFHEFRKIKIHYNNFWKVKKICLIPKRTLFIPVINGCRD